MLIGRLLGVVGLCPFYELVGWMLDGFVFVILGRSTLSRGRRIPFVNVHGSPSRSIRARTQVTELMSDTMSAEQCVMTTGKRSNCNLDDLESWFNIFLIWNASFDNEYAHKRSPAHELTRAINMRRRIGRSNLTMLMAGLNHELRVERLESLEGLALSLE